MDTIFPIDSVKQFIGSMGFNLEDTESGFQWREGPGIVSLSINHLNLNLEDGRTVSEQVVLSYTSPTIEALSNDLSLINQFNRFVVQSSIIPQFGHSNSMLVSKVGIFEQDKPAAEKIYAPIIANQAAIIAWHSEVIFNGITKFDPDHSPLSYTNQLPPYQQNNFEDLKSFFHSIGDFSITGKLKITIAFPWDNGTSAAVQDEIIKQTLLKYGLNPKFIKLAGGRACLVEIFVSQHPVFGFGLMTWLTLPINLHENDAIKFASSLNQWELLTPQLPPFFGAWSAYEGNVVFASFLPTQMCMQISNVIFNIAMWGKVRTYEVFDLLVSNKVTH